MKIELNKILTESRNYRTLDIDKKTSYQIVNLINKEDKLVAKAIKLERWSIASAIDVCVECVNRKGKIFYIGVGTSGKIAILDASEISSTYGVSTDLFISILAGGDHALRNTVENIEDDKEEAVKDLKKHKFNEKDVLIGLSASGRSPYVKAAIEYANSLNSITISISTSFDSEIGKISKIKIEAITGPEVITGSTRMKSGTAQKMILNMISTGTMIKIGKVYSNLMIDLECSNEKLKSRAISIIKELTNADETKITDLLIKNNYNIKNTIVCLKRYVDIEEANKLLKENDYILANII